MFSKLAGNPEWPGHNVGSHENLLAFCANTGLMPGFLFLAQLAQKLLLDHISLVR